MINACMDYARSRLALEGKPHTPQDCIWWLLRECMETERFLRNPWPKVRRQHGPDYFHEHVGEVGVGEETEKRPRHQPTADALDRHSEVMTWFRYAINYRHRRKHCTCDRCTLVLLAKGLSSRRVGDIQRRSHTTVRRVKARAMDRIEAGIISRTN